MTSISIITATLNSRAKIDKLIESLNNQTSGNFTWIVIDGGSVDGTVDLIAKEFKGDVKLLSEPDNGIYEALNKGIGLVDSEFYICVGSDDVLRQDTIKNYEYYLSQSNSDILVANIEIDGKIIRPRPNSIRAYSRQFKYIASHSIATCFRTSLHQKKGLYEEQYKIAADQKFILDCFTDDLIKFQYCDFVSGEFVLGGVSSTSNLKQLLECAKIQSKYDNVCLIYAIFCIRVYKHILRKLHVK